MTRIEGHPDDNLLIDLGYGGHPTLAFMNLKGEVLGRPLERSVSSFEETLSAIEDFTQLEKREKQGEKGFEFERYILEYRLMKLRGSQLVKRGKALRGLTGEQQARVDGIVLGEEVSDLVLLSMDPAKIEIAGKRMQEILDGGRCPQMVRDANAWSVLSRYAEKIRDADLLERCAKGLAENFPNDEYMQNWAQSLKKKVKALRTTDKGIEKP